MARNHSLICDLKNSRHTLGWSLKELADRCGIDERLLRDWEQGRGAPRLGALGQWAAALGLVLELAPAGNERRRGFVIDWETRCVTVDGAAIRLAPMEWKGLECLARTPGELVTHRALYRHLYGDDPQPLAQPAGIRVLITKLRRLLPVRIEAHRGQGYVLYGLSAPPPDARIEAAGHGGVGQPPAVAEQPCERDARAAKAAPRRPPVEPEPGKFGRPAVHSGITPPIRPVPRRAEELGVIERFLAERGATRCPDLPAMQRAPLPPLIWDKLKRKWVRPPVVERIASSIAVFKPPVSAGSL
jgi:transcriptional regulator with XRE-family HTH domain